MLSAAPKYQAARGTVGWRRIRPAIVAQRNPMAGPALGNLVFLRNEAEGMRPRQGHMSGMRGGRLGRLGAGVIVEPAPLNFQVTLNPDGSAQGGVIPPPQPTGFAAGGSSWLMWLALAAGAYWAYDQGWFGKL